MLRARVATTAHHEDGLGLCPRGRFHLSRCLRQPHGEEDQCRREEGARPGRRSIFSGGYRRMGRRRHHPTPRSAAIRQRETGRIQRRLPRALHGCIRPESICLVTSRGTDQRGRSRPPILGRHGYCPSAAIATRDEERRRGFTLARPVPHRLTVRQPTSLLSPGVLRPLCGALRQARSDGASPHPSLSRPRSPG